jgi:acetyltransferase-like isoleucine patch superfamily enzyme
MTVLAAPLASLHRACCGLASRWRNVYFRALGVGIDGYVWMRRIDIPRNFDQISLAKGVALDDGVTLLAVGEATGTKKIEIGENTYINRYTMIDAARQIRIGRGVGIGPHCYITDHDHGMAPGAPVMTQPLVARPTVISDGVWLGAGCIVLKGVTVGENTVVGAGSVVVHDLPADIVAVGRPARVVRKR